MKHFIRTSIGEYINISEIRAIYVDDEHTIVARLKGDKAEALIIHQDETRFKAENYLMNMMRNLCGN